MSGSCTDVAGNTSPLTSVMVKLDKTAPQTTIAAGPPNPTGSTSATLAFGASEAASFECRLDESAWMACTSPSVYNDLAKYSHQFEVRASDVAGNTDATPAQYAWTNGKTPKTTISGRPRSPTNSTHASFTFTSSDPGASYECSLDGGPFSTCTSPTSYTGLGDGGHTFAVNATDAAGRGGKKPTTAKWAVDTTAPETTITSHPLDPTLSTKASFKLVSSEQKSSFECSLDGAPFTACKSSAKYTNLASGSHTFRPRATDPAGNTDASPASFTWTIY